MNRPLVGIVDYRAGNLTSMGNAFRHLRAQVRLLTEPEHFENLTHIVLPGVGSFGFCSRQLQESQLLPTLTRWAIADQRPLLGVCVGMQLLTESSQESPGARGLGWIPAQTVRLTSLESADRLPHVGWDEVSFDTEFAYPHSGIRDYYFDHSYAVRLLPQNTPAGRCEYADGFVAAFEANNILAAQFHPEKSQRSGLDFLNFFLERK